MSRATRGLAAPAVGYGGAFAYRKVQTTSTVGAAIGIDRATLLKEKREMAATHTNIVTTVDPSAGGSLVHHCGFPEIRAEGSTPQEAAQRLASKLTRALDSALSAWRREEINQAIAEVNAFANDN